MTDASGRYFITLQGEQSVHLHPLKNFHSRNGLNEMDLVLVQAHISGNNPIDLPEHLIAADVTNDSEISTLDMVALKEFINIDIEQFPNNKSWRFIPTHYDFPDPDNPWSEPWPTDTLIRNPTSDVEGINFTGIKTGDVNASYEP